MQNRGFSLIELLVVIAIVGVLAAIAVPAYKQYAAKAVFAKSISSVQEVIKQITSNYAKKGTWPTSVTFKGITNNLNMNGGESYSVVNVDKIHAIQYGYNTGVSGAYDVLWVYIIAPYAITGYDNSYYTSMFGIPNVYLISFGFREVNGVMKIACGVRDSSRGQFTPLPYLPSSCQCTDVQGWGGGASPAGCP
jgi:prepilin-type N-terminal cleavage/methylation domain-containing protein